MTVTELGPWLTPLDSPTVQDHISRDTEPARHHVLADGAWWIDAAGRDTWLLADASAHAARLGHLGYEVTVI